MWGITTLGRNLSEARRVGIDVGIKLGNTLGLGKKLGRGLGEAPRLGTVDDTELGNTPDISKEAETGSGTSALSGTVSTKGVSSFGSTSCRQSHRRKKNPDKMQQKIYHQIQCQHLQLDLQRIQKLPRVCLEQNLE